MKRPSVSLVAILAIVASLSVPAFAHAKAVALPAGVPVGSKQATVKNYSDARAFVVDLAGKDATVILIGIDVPDPHHGGGGDCYAAEATAHVREVLPVGTVVYLESDTKRDDGQGHLLRYVWVLDPTTSKAYLLNTKLVRDGYAVYGQLKPDTRYDANLKKAEATAKKKHAGLWGACGGAHILLSAVAAPTAVPTTDSSQAAPQGLSADEQAYIDRVLPDIDAMGKSAKRFSDLMANPQLGVDTWTLSVAAELVTWKMIDDDIHTITPPPAFATMHDLLTQAFDLYASAADDIANGIDTLDSSLLYAALDKINQANDLVTQATQELSNIKQERGITT